MRAKITIEVVVEVPDLAQETNERLTRLARDLSSKAHDEADSWIYGESVKDTFAVVDSRSEWKPA